MEYRTVATKIPSSELTLFKAYCERKGVTPACLIRELILKEIKITVPNVIAGRNRIKYNKNLDSFVWSIELDTGEPVEVIKNVSPDFLEDFRDIIQLSLGERDTFIRKSKRDSIPIPSDLVKRK